MKIADDSEATPVCVCVKLRAPVPLADQFGTTPDNTLDSGFMTGRDLDAIYACLSAIPAATPGSCTNAGQWRGPPRFTHQSQVNLRVNRRIALSAAPFLAVE